jgi:hypothetical protein
VYANDNPYCLGYDVPRPPVEPQKSFQPTLVPAKPNVAPKINKMPVDVKLVPYVGPADLVGSIVGEKWTISE